MRQTSGGHLLCGAEPKIVIRRGCAIELGDEYLYAAHRCPWTSLTDPLRPTAVDGRLRSGKIGTIAHVHSRATKPSNDLPQQRRQRSSARPSEHAT
jgi:hypothetical protein